MPRTKADSTVIHRIEFGVKEREMLESALGAFQFNRVATAVVAGMSDVSFMLTFAGILTIWFPDIVLPTAGSSSEQVIAAVNDGIKAGASRAAAEREATGEATLDESTGVRDFFGRLWFNVTNPNWAIGDPDAQGVMEALDDLV